MATGMSLLLTFIVTVGLAIFYSFLYGYNVPGVQHRHKKITTVKRVYDYVIIGGGSAGSVIGSRLSEDENISVLILEAGDHYDNIPGIHDPTKAMMFPHTRADWDYMSTHNPAFLGNLERKHFITSGRVLGGSSAINYNCFVRGSPYHFDEWVTYNGCEGWGYKDLLPYFKKSESMQIERLSRSEYHNVDGPIAITELPVSNLYKIFTASAKQIGYDELDYNGPTQSGVGKLQFSLRNGVRSSVGLEYLNDEILQERSNIDVSVNSIVAKIHVENKVANGVYFINDGRKRYVEARREVIVSAGALNSPQILMLSGIGPKTHLEQLGIPAVSDLPVGKRFDNHVAANIHVKFDKSYNSAEEPKSAWSAVKAKLFGFHPTNYAPFVMQGFFHYDKSTIGKEKPNVQMVLTQNIFDFSRVYNYDPEVAEEMRKSIHNVNGFSAFIFLLQPKSSGTVKLNTSDPFDSPIFNDNQLSNVEDIKMLVKGIRLVEEMTSTDALKQTGADLSINKYSFCSAHHFRSDAFWECVVRHTGYITSHYASTCRMGPLSNETAVVDLLLKVKGVGHLRVCDASVFPTVTTGNLFAPTLALAEKAADMIKSEQ